MSVSHFRFFYSDLFDLQLPQGHRYPAQKYSLLRNVLMASETLHPDQLIASPLCSFEDLTLAHDPEYVLKVFEGRLSVSEIRRMGFPWNERLVLRSRATVGGAIAAACAALETGLSGQLAGGTHHAHADFGSGYCVFNDFAVTARKLLMQGSVKRIGILDLDVHQGDGNASILLEPEVQVVSVHGQNNFPFRKFPSDLDIALEDGCGDQIYLLACERALEHTLKFAPDLILYQAGVDALEADTLGRLKVSLEGLRKRDELILQTAFEKRIPISMAIGGGYSDPIDSTLGAYVQTYQVAKKIYKF